MLLKPFTVGIFMYLDDYVLYAYLLTAITLISTTVLVIRQFYRRRRALSMIERLHNKNDTANKS